MEDDIKYSESGRKAKDKGKPVYVCHCDWCGDDFYNGRPDAHLCSNSCRKAYYKDPNRQKREGENRGRPTGDSQSKIIPINNNQKFNNMAEENKSTQQDLNKPFTQGEMEIRDLKVEVRTLEAEKQALEKKLNDANALLRTSADNIKKNKDGVIAEKDAVIENLNAELAKVRAYAKEIEDKTNEEDDELLDENESLRSEIEGYKAKVKDLYDKLDEAEKHNTEIKQNITGKLQIPMDDFARKCYVTWCETYSKDPRWSDNYKQNAAQFEKWGLAPNSLNMPILMVLANMLGKVDSISFDCKIPKEVVVKIAEDCKTQK
ncbi:MAG: hypothetical protein IIT61_03045 [Bacteroidales bacterium]|nr:hypothetical protein [Bacteroidales bacterium]MBQ2351511.1 hypothetical protein [Bacteroidales bacterium]MBQ2573966.1 hypothetical protein [Bacteroidales bacterium]MBQ5423939.1 hypothetical protein [Bacteroidales bacterium]MBQ5457679.1 hypothetical protein [Bacteroidales bacterium]